MPRTARVPAAVSLLLFLGFLWLSRLEIAVRFPKSYYLPDRTRAVGVLVGWCAVLSGCLAVAVRRGHVGSRWSSRPALVLLLVGAVVLSVLRAHER